MPEENFLLFYECLLLKRFFYRCASVIKYSHIHSFDYDFVLYPLYYVQEL